MPDFEITAPDGRKFIVTAPEGASQDDILRYAQSSMPAAPPKATATRALGLGVRDAIEGVGQIPGMVYDAAALPLNLGIRGVNAVTGAGIPEIRSARENLVGVGDAMGLPTPATPRERIASDVGQNVAGIIPTMGAGAALGPASRVGQALMAAPVSQVAGAAGAGLAGGAAREEGYGPAAQAGAALAGGITGAAVPTVASMLGNGVSSMMQPFSNTGRQRIVAEALLRNSSDPQTLAQRLREGADDPARRLPGSPVTAGVAARDPQMMALESGLRSDIQTAPGVMSPATAFRDVDAQRNANRLTTAQTLLRGDGDVASRGATVREGLDAAEKAMKAQTNRLYEAAATGQEFPVKPIADKLKEVQKTYFGTLSGGMPAELKSVADDLSALLKPPPPPVQGPPVINLSPTPLPPPVPGAGPAATVDWQALQNLTSRVGDIVGRAQAGPDKNARVVAAGKQLMSVIDDLGSTPQWQAAKAQRRAVGEALLRDQTGTNATGRVMQDARFGMPQLPNDRVAPLVTSSPDAVKQTLGALKKSAEDALSAGVPDDQLMELNRRIVETRRAMRDQVIDDMLRASRTTSDIADASGNVSRQLSPAQFRRWWEKNLGTVDQLFTGEERKTMERLAADFAESTLPATVRTRGSDTAQNLSVGNFIARLTGGVIDPQNPLAQSMGRLGPVAEWIVGAPEQAMREMLVTAMRDPKFAAMLVENAGPRSLERAMTYWQGTMGTRVRNAATDALIREVPRVLLADPSQAPGRKQGQGAR